MFQNGRKNLPERSEVSNIPLCNFIISGGDNETRVQILYSYLEKVFGKIPVIILHDKNDEMVKMAGFFSQSGSSSVWSLENNQGDFEPFLEVQEDCLVDILTHTARKLGYSPSPEFEKVVRAHVELLQCMNRELCLTNLYDMAQYRDLIQFKNNILALSNDDNARKICSDMGLNSDDRSSLEMFRSVINKMGYDASFNEWTSDCIGDVDVSKALNENNLLAFSFDYRHAESLIPYLLESLSRSTKQFVLILDSINIADEDLSDYLVRSSSRCKLGIIADDVPALFGLDYSKYFSVLSSKMDLYYIFSHRSTFSSEEFSKVIGQHEVIRRSTSKGTSRRLFEFWGTRTADVSESIDKEYRILPEEIAGLEQDHYFLYNSIAGKVYKYVN